MIKPFWNGAPSWAQYLVMDDGGEWSWFEKKPEFNGSWWWPKNGGKHETAYSEDLPCASSSLECRPHLTSNTKQLYNHTRC